MKEGGYVLRKYMEADGKKLKVDDMVVFVEKRLVIRFVFGVYVADVVVHVGGRRLRRMCIGDSPRGVTRDTTEESVPYSLLRTPETALYPVLRPRFQARTFPSELYSFTTHLPG